jgi:Asp-tRNA(Asn)/Glu-tRNA(Gln) amidotransferase A subunit family amidase
VRLQTQVLEDLLDHRPLKGGSDGLPIGLQAVGRWGQDHRLLAHAQWVHERLLR